MSSAASSSRTGLVSASDDSGSSGSTAFCAPRARSFFSSFFKMRLARESDFFGHARKGSDFDAEAARRPAPHDLAQKDDGAVDFAGVYFIVLDAFEPPFELGELVIVRCKERLCADLFVEIFDDRPRDGKPVVSARAAPHFVEDEKGAGKLRCAKCWRLPSFPP